MKQVLIRKGQAFLENVPAPIIEPGRILVEVAYSLISTGTEISSVKSSGESLVKKMINNPEKTKKALNFLQNQGIKKTFAKIQSQVDQANPTGYSCSGVVIQVGEGITDIQPGDRVACAGAGYANHSEIVLVPHNLVVKIPDLCELKDAASVTLGSIAMQGVRRADPRLGEIVVVIGLGLLGIITCQILKAAGCIVIGMDIDDRRVTLAKQLGADFSFNSLEQDIAIEIRNITNDHGADATIITAASNSDALAQQAIEITKKKGKVVIVGAVGLGLKRSPLYEKEIDFLISCSYGPGRYDPKYEEKGLDYPYAYVRWTENRNMQEYLRLVASQKITLSLVLEREYQINQVKKAYEELSTNTDKPLAVLLSYPMFNDKDRNRKLETKILIKSKLTEGKVRIAIIGAGGFAKSVHLPNLKKLPNLFHLRAIVSATSSNAKLSAQQFGADYASTNFQDVLDDPAVDAVIISTRHNLHAQQAIQAAKAGKAILLEKPMALNMDELDQLVAVLEETKVPFMVGYNRRFSPAAKIVKEIISSRNNPVLIYYRMNAGFIPKDHWIQSDEGGGRIIGEACHIFDLFQYLIDSPVKSVNSFSINTFDDNFLSNDNSIITVSYVDGSIATLLYTSLGSSSLSKEYMELFFDGKSLILDDYKIMKVFGVTSKVFSSGSQDKGHLEELREFADLVLNSKNLPTNIMNLVETSTITFKAKK